MEKSTVIGVVLGVLAIGVGMVLKGASLTALINPAAFLIIIVGTAAALLNAFPMDQIKNFPVLCKKLVKKDEHISKSELLKLFVELSQVARREGILALESRLEEIHDPFLRNGMSMVIDGMDVDFVRDVLDADIEAMEERHRSGALIFSQAGMYAPTLGVLGAVIGLIAALGNLNDIEALGHAIAAAFVATLLGIFTGYVLWHRLPKHSLCFTPSLHGNRTVRPVSCTPLLAQSFLCCLICRTKPNSCQFHTKLAGVTHSFNYLYKTSNFKLLSSRSYTILSINNLKALFCSLGLTAFNHKFLNSSSRFFTISIVTKLN